MNRDPFAHIRRALDADPNPDDAELREYANIDYQRFARKGVPEVVYAASKSEAQVAAIAQRMLARNGVCLISRASPALMISLREQFATPDYRCDSHEAAAIVALYRADYLPPATGGRVAILSAGTSDIPRAEEARIVAEAMGCTVRTCYDVGVAGLHRLFAPLRQMLAWPADVYIVAAGMDGALPSVVTGLVDAPVIGLPTAVGYGLGGGGEAAILTMLQSCAPGLTVVNIDNGVGAGASAGLIANRAARVDSGRSGQVE